MHILGRGQEAVTLPPSMRSSQWLVPLPPLLVPQQMAR